ncbi:MAG: EAL domain-containing protein [Gammaproteobacteria bacterium]|nr:EAL domain-containing protein [Gammaproteobacteria bacterium]MBU1645557.1 EAL domain-containing protein [Gammaproteobacteria bacterium]MBU1973641.1 EAL domain-containing protein [Gammaproteobacteria bacterium]
MPVKPPIHPYPDGELPPVEADRLWQAAIEAPTSLDADAVRALARHGQALARRIRGQALMLDRIRESVITMDLVGFITGWNKGAEQLFGYRADEAIGRNILFLCDENDADGNTLEDAFLEHGGREMEVRRRKKSGELFWASMLLSVVHDDDGDPSGLIGHISDITERKQTEERIYALAYHDPLTGLANRASLFKVVDQALAVAQRNAMSGALLFIDLNRFKPINDTLGHTVGDRVLTEIAERLLATLRDEDVVARIGGDEFVVGLLDIARTEHASIVAQKILASIAEPFFIDDHELRLGAAIGISLYPQDGSDIEALLAAADIAMYRAKHGSDGVEGYAFYADNMNERTAHRLRIETGLRHAIERDELLLYYQPKVAISDGRIVGAEALVRWRHPERGLVPPGEFIPVAEETGLILQVSEWVLHAACAQSRRWADGGLAPLKIAINLSAREFNPRLPARIAAALAHHGIGAERLDLEITEGMLMNSTEQVIAMMAELAAMGLSLSLDDFGTGYSSLSYLRRFPIDSLKIDRSFVIDLPHDANAGAIASAIVSMSKRLQHRVVAEGVETRAQLEFLEAHGCDEIQGYFFSPPVPPEEFEAMVRQDRRLQT